MASWIPTSIYFIVKASESVFESPNVLRLPPFPTFQSVQNYLAR